MDNTLKSSCGKCSYEWVEVFPLPMQLKVFAKRLKDARCPQCGSSKVLIDTKDGLTVNTYRGG